MARQCNPQMCGGCMDIDFLRNSFEYDETAGQLIRKSTGNAVGTVCLKRSGHKQLRVWFNGKYHLAHRLIWAIVHGSPPKDGVDHIDGDPLNNKISNLRLASQAVNNKNKRAYVNSKSGISGVSYRKRDNVWIARVQHNNKLMHIGSFNNLFDAAAARQSALNKLGFSSRHGR